MGSSTAVNETSCGASRSLGKISAMKSPPKTAQVGYLVGDGTWRSLDLDLKHWIQSSGARFEIRFCASIGGPFSGSFEMQIQSAGISVVAPAQDLLKVGRENASPVLRVSLRTGSVITAREVTARIVIGLSLASSYLMNQTQGTGFDSRLPKPSITVMDGVNDPRSSPSSRIQGLVFYSRFSHLNPRVSVNGSSTDGGVVQNGSVFVAGRSFDNEASGDPRQSTELSLLFRGDSLSLLVKDANNNPVTGAIVGVKALRSAGGRTQSTDSYGRTHFYLLPSNYALSVEFQGALVSTSDINLGANQTLTIEAKVYQIAIKLSDALGHPLVSARVLLSNGRNNLTGTSDPKGMFVAKVVGDGVYGVEVQLGGRNYYRGNLSASINNALVSIGTSYYPLLLQLEIVAAVVGLFVFAGIVLYFPRSFSRLPRKLR